MIKEKSLLHIRLVSFISTSLLDFLMLIREAQGLYFRTIFLFCKVVFPYYSIISLLISYPKKNINISNWITKLRSYFSLIFSHTLYPLI